jgi:L-ribulokinase
MSSSFSLGIDYGTSSVRALIVDNATGEEVATSVHDYPSGEQGILLDRADPNLARQNPADYFEGFTQCIRGALAKAAASVPGFPPGQIVGIGVDTTGSTPVPVDRNGTPLALLDEFRNEHAAHAWLWKDHTSHAEAAEITQKATQQGLPYLAKCGGTYSSEWYWSKILHCERTSPRVAQAAYGWVEQSDLIPAYLTGNTSPETLVRSICAAGHKGMYHESWGGLPSAAFLDSLSPGLSRFRARYRSPAVASDQLAGKLDAKVAAAAGLPPGIPVAVGGIDAHLGAVGSGCGPGTLVKIMGTSTCDCMVAPMDKPLADIPGVCGIVPGSILPRMYGIEAGQSAVGDIFNWFVNRIGPSGYGSSAEMHARLSEAAGKLRPGESGLVALDWHNGNRTVLVDPLLTGLIVGESLATTPAEIYRALVEATAFGARAIIDRIEEYGVRIERIVNCGGIAEKSPLVMQIYADVCDRPMFIARSGQACALGAAIFGSVVGGAHRTVQNAQGAMTGVKPAAYQPNPAAVSIYQRLYGVYRALHDAFGTASFKGSLHNVMKELIRIRQRARSL